MGSCCTGMSGLGLAMLPEESPRPKPGGKAPISAPPIGRVFHEVRMRRLKSLSIKVIRSVFQWGQADVAGVARRPRQSLYLW